MFAKLSTLALALALPLVSALTINSIEGGITGETVTITWSASTTDAAYFSIELVNTVFHNTFAIANNVQTSLGTITLTLPQVPVGDGYTIEAVATNDVNTVYSQSGDFSIGAVTTTSATAASTSSTPATTGTGTTTSPATVSTPSVTATTPVSSVTPGSTSGTSTAASSTPSTFSSGAVSFKVAGMAPAAALVLSAVAGAAMVF